MAKRSQPGGRNSKSGKGRSERNSNPDSRKSSSTGGKPRAERKGTSSRSDSPKSYGSAAGRKPRFAKDDSSDSRKGNFGKRSDSPKSYGSASERKPRFAKDDSSDSRKGNFGKRSDSPKSYGSASERKPRFAKDDSSDSRKGNFGKRSDSPKPYRTGLGSKPRFDSEKGDSGKKSSSFSPKGGFKDDDKKAGGFQGKKFDTNEKSRSGRFSDDSRRETEGHYQAKTPAQIEKIRLNRYIANSGVCSRREADELITMGLITVNGKSITELGFKVDPGDEVRYEGRLLRAEKPVYILLNKPKGYLTTTNDPQERDTVMHLIGDKVRERIYPVGRLDRNTTGLLLLTNDGELAEKLMHPSYNVKKIYKVELDRPLTKGDFQKIREGVRLEEGVAQVDDLAIVSEDGRTVGIELHIGWNRVVRRIFESMEYDVVKLDRSVYAGLDKKELSRGQWRFLRQEEVVRLKHYK
jgi:23S rRNA pseudouridine2605 synthase